MADYYPLLERAVSGLKTSTPESRRAIYERARKAMFNQLRAMQPPAPEDAIEREARALDEAIVRLERGFYFFPPVAAGKFPGNTIHRYSRSGSVEPKLGVSDRPRILDVLAEKLPNWLKSEAAKFRRKKQVKKLRADLVSLGFGP